MWAGLGFALAAGLMWGLVFVSPLLLPDYPALMLSLGRYLAFGLIALPLGWFDRAELARLSRADWLEALKLAAVGNLLYYLLLASAIQRAGAPLPTMIIGTLPVVIPICANLFNHQRDGRLRWSALAPSLLLIAAGIACVNQVELGRLAEDTAGENSRYAIGALLAVGAMLCWTWYPIRNSNWMRAHPDRNPRAWSTAQGLATLPLALCGFAIFATTNAIGITSLPLPLGPEPAGYIGLMLAVGFFASWLGTLCWNAASQRLPTSLAGQLIVFETISALAYAFMLRGQWPAPLTALGIGLLLAGVMLGTRVRAEPVESAH